ncbi:MAG TPA: twin-arginine translocation signal domain-containing protein [Pyrinomonadaceae bacterium]|nr:twin-arginine translocation signal domain-containing protein [Pyrinomonadaceae bacterium]
MATSRRDFIKKGTIVALAAGVPLSVSAKSAREAGITTKPAAAGYGLKKSLFESQLNTTFLIKKGAAEFPVSLVAVTDLHRYKGVPAHKEGFTLSFRAKTAKALNQDTYIIEHKELGLFSLLLVPGMTKDKSVRHYEAVINHLHP